MFVRMISSEPQNILLPNLVWLCNFINQSVMQKKIGSVCSVSRSQWGLLDSKFENFYCIFWTADPVATKLGLIIPHHKPECPVEKMGLLRSRSRSQRRFKMSVNVCPDDIFWTTEHFVTKLGVVMQHHKQECSLKNWITTIKVKVTAKVKMSKSLS